MGVVREEMAGSVVAEAGWGCSSCASFKPCHYRGQPVSCVLVGESRVKRPVSHLVGRGGEKTTSHPVGHLVSWTQREADTSQSFSHLIRHTVSQTEKRMVTRSVSQTDRQTLVRYNRHPADRSTNRLSTLLPVRHGDSQPGRQTRR